MAKPAWSTDNVTWNTLPGAWKFGGRPRNGVQRSAIELETDSGVTFVYGQSSRRVKEIVFRVSEDDLAFYATLDATVNGNQYPFYFSLKGDGSDSIWVRKEMGFDPVELTQPNKKLNESMYDYTMNLREEIA